jgi:DNA-binding beta-propeller fold protein YncE
MFVIGSVTDAVYAYDLGTAWSVTTSVWDAPTQNYFSVAAQETAPNGLFFKPDGTKMYVTGAVGDDVNEYNLSTAWDISTASFLQLFSVVAQENNPQGVFFKPDGTKMYVIGQQADAVWAYDLGTAWSVTTSVWDVPTQNYFSVAAQEGSPSGLFFKPDGLKMYVIGTIGDDVNEYDLGTAWEVSTASFLQSFSVAAQEINPQGLFFKPDGTKMYVIGTSGDDVNEYDLSTAWDISTASFLQLFSVSAQDGNPTGLFFKPDGTKMYIIGSAEDNVNEYDLSTVWDISTASFLQLFSVAVQYNQPSGLFFKPDGTKMYIIGISDEKVNEYDLSIAWDISTASFLQSFSVVAQDSNANDVFFKPDGTRMYIIGSANDAVWAYDL